MRLENGFDRRGLLRKSANIAARAALTGGRFMGGLSLHAYNDIILPLGRLTDREVRKPMPQMSRRTFLASLGLSVAGGVLAHRYYDERSYEAKLQNALKVSERLESLLPDEVRESAKSDVSLIVMALEEEGIADNKVIAYALATVGVETAYTFKPIEEFYGRYQAVILNYEGGSEYFGRGYIQLTHRGNYLEFGRKIGLGDLLARNPELALNSQFAAKILARYFKDRGVVDNVRKGDLTKARINVNGGTLGLVEINQIYNSYLKALEN